MHRWLCCASLLLAACGSESTTPRDGAGRPPDLFPARKDVVPPGCSSATCTTCCLSGAVCVAQPGPSACGFAGNVCQTCKTDELCTDGLCTPQKKCDATTCKTGCCDDKGACKSGSADDACGAAGGACQVCDAASKQVCTAGKCGAKGSGSYKVSVVGCHIDQGWWSGPCSMESSCDPYVTLTVGKTAGQSSIKADTNDPVWNDQLLNASETEITTSFEIAVYDDNWGPDTKIGACSWKVTSADLAAGKIVQHCGSPLGSTYVKDLTFSFQPL